MSFAAKAAALLVFLSAIGGATYAVQVQLGDDAGLAGAALRASAVHPLLNATAGHAVAFPVLVANRGGEDVRIVARLSGEGFEGASPAALLPADSNQTLFVPVQVGASAAPGAHALDLALESADGKVLRRQADAATLRVMGPAPGFGDGVRASIVYVGRLSDGKVFNTNDPDLLPLPFPKAAIYQPSPPGGFSVTGSPQPSVVRGFYEVLLGMQAGESRTATIPAEKAYGPRTVDSASNRTETLERDYELPIRSETVARGTFDAYVAETSQGSDWSAGDVFFYEQGSNRWPYRIESLNASSVVYRLSVEPGQRFTLYPFWENASEVVSVGGTGAVLRTTPTTQVGGAFTMRSYWPDMTTLVGVEDASIVVRHDPPVGFKYTLPGGAQPVETTVKSVDDATIVTTTPSSNPLAGEDLTFDVFVASLTT